VLRCRVTSALLFDLRAEIDCFYVIIHPMNLDYLTGKKFAIWAVSEKKTSETDSAVFSGIARWADGHLFLDRDDNVSFQLPDDTLERIKPVPAEVADILLEAEFYVSLYIAPLPDDANPKEYLNTGLKWPE
jgi:hypothetical protein